MRLPWIGLRFLEETRWEGGEEGHVRAMRGAWFSCAVRFSLSGHRVIGLGVSLSLSLSLQLGGSAAFEDLSARTAAAPRRTGRTARGGGGLVASVPLCPVHHHRTGSTNFSWAIRWWWFLVAPKIVAVFC